MHLPPELILYIALFVPKRYEPRRNAGADHTASLAKSDLTSLATVSKSLRQVLLPVLFADVSVHTSSRLTALSKAPDHIMGLVRTFTVELDLDFYETWIWSLDHKAARSSLKRTSHTHNPALGNSLTSPKRSQSTTTGPDATTNHQLARNRSKSDPVYALASILVRAAPTLRTFRFVMHSRPTSSGSAWSQFPRPGMAGIPFAGDVVSAMEAFILTNTSIPTASDEANPSSLLFPELRNLNLDGTADVRPFLSMTPNLTSLRLRIPEGFNAADCANIIHSLPLVPKLRQLEMWVWELAAAQIGSKGLASANPNDNTTAATPLQTSPEADSNQLVQRERVRLLGLIGQACPNLEWIGFQTRSFDYADGGMGLRVVGEKGFDWKDFVPALAHFSALRELHLPGTLHSKDEQFALALNMKSAIEDVNALQGNASTVPPPITLIASSPPLSPTAPLTPLEQIETRERETSAVLIRSSCGHLNRVSWVRAEGLVGVEYVISDDGSEVQKSPVVSTLAYATREYKSRLFDPEWWEEETQLLWDDDEDAHYYTYEDFDGMGIAERRQREREATNAASLTSQLRDLGAGAAMVYRAIFPPSNRPGQFRSANKSNSNRRTTSTSPSRRSSSPRASAAVNFRNAATGYDPHFHDRVSSGAGGSQSFLNGYVIYGLDAETLVLLGVESFLYLVFTSTLAVASWRTLNAIVAVSASQIKV
ncbi:hypothetical protein FRC04_008964 [Tulasnella sp. 424]|nr:hypothetical protein FRC04_008964 [Tulasnella sp. 424]KAG8973620.1 hypothetical protein FRC05_008556 [Tulasnella sp. 425]